MSIDRAKFAQVSGEDVRLALEQIVPGVKHVTPDAIGAAAERLGLATPWVLMPDREWDAFAALDARRVVDMVLLAGPPPEGALIVVTDDVYPEGLGVPAEQFRALMESHESWVGSDVVVIAAEQRRVIVIHHGGAYVHIYA